MPGMMDTILNLGLNDETVEALARISENEAFAYDSYRRFLQMYGDVVLQVEHDRFEEILSDVRGQAGVETDYELDADALEAVAQAADDTIEIGIIDPIAMLGVADHPDLTPVADEAREPIEAVADDAVLVRLREQRSRLAGARG